ncbi:MAG: ribonuclease Y [Abditibacteriales bacterium]|nr:ribonuclease Y [Abditibacteriales bacterium]
MEWGIAVIAAVIGLAAGLVVGYFILCRPKLEQHQRAVAEAQTKLSAAEREFEAKRKELLLEAKEESHRLRQEVERESRERRQELNRLERRLAQREEGLERRLQGLEKRERHLTLREQELNRAREEVMALREKERQELERIAGLTSQQAKEMLLKAVEEESRQEMALLIRKLEERAREEADKQARKIVTLAIQRCCVDQAAETSVSVVPLPNEDMKGRIIGREGRNIRAFESLTGVDLIIDDTPEAVVISAFDPVRREIARTALEALVNDGRIHPGRIEDVVLKARAQVESKIREMGERACLETGVTLPLPLMEMLGRLHFRSSYGQNVLAHSIEVSHLAAMMAAEVKADVTVARRAGLLHDLGKAVDHKMEGTHVSIALDLLRRYNENERVIHAVEAHHGDVEPIYVEDILVMAADAISSSRPGARRESLETYVRRLEKLEEIADSFPGVDKSFAIQAGRELRIVVKPDEVDDLLALQLSRDIAKRIEQEVQYPGEIKVTVIRETRAVDYAR